MRTSPRMSPRQSVGVARIRLTASSESVPEKARASRSPPRRNEKAACDSPCRIDRFRTSSISGPRSRSTAIRGPSSTTIVPFTDAFPVPSRTKRSPETARGDRSRSSSGICRRLESHPFASGPIVPEKARSTSGGPAPLPRTSPETSRAASRRDALTAPKEILSSPARNFPSGTASVPGHQGASASIPSTSPVASRRIFPAPARGPSSAATLTRAEASSRRISLSTGGAPCRDATQG